MIDLQSFILERMVNDMVIGIILGVVWVIISNVFKKGRIKKIDKNYV